MAKTIYFHGGVGTIVTGGNGVIEIRGGKIYQNGKEVTAIPTEEQDITINVQGDLERLEVQYCNRINVTGDSRRVKTNHGDIEIGGNVDGDVYTNMGDISCKDVFGDARTNMGNIYKNKDAKNDKLLGKVNKFLQDFQEWEETHEDPKPFNFTAQDFLLVQAQMLLKEVKDLLN